MMTKEGSTQIVNFMTPGTGVLMLRRGHISYLVHMYSIYSTLIDIVLRDYDAAVLIPVDFHLFYDRTVDIQI